MLTDAHCHPFDLAQVLPNNEEERRRLGVAAAASACDLEEFEHNDELARKAAADNAAVILPCFAVHPQLPAVNADGSQVTKERLENLLTTLRDLSADGKLAAVGECGFDLYNAAFKETEPVQDWLFEEQLKTALRYDLPVIIHARKAMHKIFASIKSLAKCKAVAFHSWSGTYEEGQTLLRRGVNAYFSFGNVILNGHKRAMRCCALFAAQRLLTETDAPFQPQRGKDFSRWADIPLIIKTAAALRSEAQSSVTDAKELEAVIEKNFFDVFAPTVDFN
jgi:TatD DNase family protein